MRLVLTWNVGEQTVLFVCMLAKDQRDRHSCRFNLDASPICAQDLQILVDVDKAHRRCCLPLYLISSTLKASSNIPEVLGCCS